MSRMSPLSRSLLLEGTSGTKGTSLSASVFSVLLVASLSRKEPESGRDGVLDRTRLPAGLVQTSPAAPQLNLWDGSLWGDSPTDSILQPGGSGFSRRPLRRGREGLGHAPYTS
jgi:hypothetical protein